MDDEALDPHYSELAPSAVLRIPSVDHLGELDQGEEASTFGNTLLNLAKVILGAGMMVSARSDEA